MLRSFVIVPFGLVWTALIYSLAGLTGTLALGLAGPWLTNLWAPIWGWGILLLAGIRLEIVGAEHIRGRAPRVIVLNHSSMLDMVVLGALNPPGFMAMVKREFAWNPFIGWGLWATGHQFVDRKDPERSRAGVRRMGERMRREGRSVVVFPEGTRSRDGSLRPFKMGAFHIAFQTRAPLIPVVIHGAWNLNRAGSFLVRSGHLVVHVHPPRPTDDWEEADLKRIASDLNSEYAGWLAAGPPG